MAATLTVGIPNFGAIINPPEAAILAVAAAEKDRRHHTFDEVTNVATGHSAVVESQPRAMMVAIKENPAIGRVQRFAEYARGRASPTRATSAAA